MLHPWVCLVGEKDRNGVLIIFVLFAADNAGLVNGVLVTLSTLRDTQDKHGDPRLELLHQPNKEKIKKPTEPGGEDQVSKLGAKAWWISGNKTRNLCFQLLHRAGHHCYTLLFRHVQSGRSSSCDRIKIVFIFKHESIE